MPDMFFSPDLLPYWVAAGVLVGLVVLGFVATLTWPVGCPWVAVRYRCRPWLTARDLGMS